ncbi:inositol 2-dehydrogenase [Flavihumibacter fluvii]|uniref:inositol 2-dehydrogenase n=1 Tax=Flavihumibacter fluvii TaxID=2838157 RepID=UPI001BDE21C5|nr:inositol 2-dehydrogenase [Flavihumibacter fluvii]ULQ54039.1 inositol 2-dehydrogenase [Flavihumibacter fluvii]
MAKIRIGIIGLGRIGKIHLENLCTRIEGVEVIGAMNPSKPGQKFAERFNLKIVTDNAGELINNPGIDAIVISSPTDSHADYVIQAARAGKAIFCEKPLDLSLVKVKETLQIVKASKVPLMLAFNQRLDPNFADVKVKISEGKIGKLHTVHIISRDPAPPPISFIKRSGGLFMDMTIHDFDMANFLVDAEVVEVYAKGYNLVDPEIGKAGDIDTGVVIITFRNHVTVLIENSRKATYGYDQRLEVFGSKGMIRVENPLKTTNSYFNEEGRHSARNPDFFMDRYIDSYFQEMKVFIESLQAKKVMPITGEDGLKAMLIAEAANRSVKENRPIQMKEILNAG